MNAPTTFAKPDRMEQHVLASQRLARVAAKYAEQVERSAGRFTETTEFARFALCNAIIGLVDDGDALAEREAIMDALRIDEQGDPESDLVPIRALKNMGVL